MIHRIFTFVVLAVLGLGILGCSGLDDNRKSREAFLGYANVLEAESAYIIDNGIIDPVALATSDTGSFDKAACVEHSMMLEYYKQDLPAMAKAMREWAEGKDVSEYKPEDVDHDARCVAPTPEPDPEPIEEPVS